MTGLKSAHAAIEEIIEQGEGARGDWQPAHYGRFLGIWEEYRQLREQDPSFDPARPVIPAFTRQPFDIPEPQPLLTEPVTRTVAELFNLGYETLLQLLTRFFTHTDETDEQLGALAEGAFGLMGGVLGPLGRALTRLPAGGAHPGRTAGPTFEMYYQMGNFVPWRGAAWAVLSERAAVLAGPLRGRRLERRRARTVSAVAETAADGRGAARQPRATPNSAPDDLLAVTALRRAHPEMNAPIDLRSDAVSKPSKAMRRAMAAAEVGADWYGDDPTVNRLQDRAAELTGKEAAAYLPTGTMCNQVAMHAFANAGHFVVCEASAHVGGTEVASAAVLSGIAFHPIPAPARGLLTVGQV